MLLTADYNRLHALMYAERYALTPNPRFGNFSGIGGNCTNFVSQCVYAGCCRMNFTPTFGWYFLSLDDRAPAWTGVDYFYRFITSNEGIGPFGRECALAEVGIGDVLQLGNDERGGFYHSVLVVDFDGEDPLVAAQSDNYYRRPLSSYNYEYLRGIKILGVRLPMPESDACFDRLYNGEAILTACDSKGCTMNFKKS